MGNRAVICEESAYPGGIGIYLHWNGGRDSVEAFLKYCRLRGLQSMADLVMVISNFFGGDTSIEVDLVSKLDCDNWDNGVYLIKDMEIVGRKFVRSGEQNEYDIDGMVEAINEAQPAKQQIPVEFLHGVPVSPEKLKVGDIVSFRDWHGNFITLPVIGFGKKGEVVNGSDVSRVPFVGLYGKTKKAIRQNVSNYLIRRSWSDTEYRLVVPEKEEKEE